MPRFVILEHDYPLPHWDLMLEAGAMLRTWRLSSPPRRGEVIRAVAVFDHRLIYLDYEGPISGNRGRVLRWDHGNFTGQVQDAKSIVVHLHGQRLQGVLRLEQEEGDSWQGEFRAEESGS
ncbi:MAG: DNA polymerase ligase N-terminal domain-containing protein [Gemmataceae bacterium]